MGEYKTIRPKRKIFKWLYIHTFLWITGRALKASYRANDEIRKNFDSFPNGFKVALEVLPFGPAMVIGKTEEGKVKYFGSNVQNQNIDLKMVIYNIEGAMRLFTLGESTGTSFMRNRLYLDGEIPYAASFVRIFDALEVLLFPKMIAKLGVKRYPDWSMGRKVTDRIKLCFYFILGI